MYAFDSFAFFVGHLSMLAGLSESFTWFSNPDVRLKMRSNKSINSLTHLFQPMTMIETYRPKEHLEFIQMNICSVQAKHCAHSCLSHHDGRRLFQSLRKRVTRVICNTLISWTDTLCLLPAGRWGGSVTGIYIVLLRMAQLVTVQKVRNGAEYEHVNYRSASYCPCLRSPV